MKRHIATVVLIAGAWLVWHGRAEAQNRCYDCHQAQQVESEREHLEAWLDSTHQRAGVGCEDCHGGDASTLVQLSAHRGVRHSFSKKAPTHWTRLPETCGSCHVEMFEALQRSQHWQLFLDGSRKAPTCSTCHGSLAVAELGPGGLNAECGSCHSENATVPTERIVGSNYLGRIREVRDLRGRVSRRVLQLRDPAMRHDAGDAFYDGSQAWEEAMDAGHSFQLDAMLTSLDRAESLWRELDEALDQASRERGDDP